MQADAAREVLAAGIPEGMTQEMLSSIQSAMAAGMELTREQMQALDIRVTQGMANRIEAEWVAIWFVTSDILRVILLVLFPAITLFWLY
jgi:phage terminase Nu1 subunit (DNA packaging protein)